MGGGAPYCLWIKNRNIISATNQVATRANKAPPRTKPQHKQEKKTCNCSYPSTFSQATTSGEARPLHSAIVHLGRLDSNNLMHCTVTFAVVPSFWFMPSSFASGPTTGMPARSTDSDLSAHTRRCAHIIYILHIKYTYQFRHSISSSIALLGPASHTITLLFRE